MKVEWVRLGDVLEPSQAGLPIVAGDSYRNAGLLNRGRGLFEKPRLEGAETSYKTLFRLSEGQVVYSKLFGWEGSVAIVPTEFDGAYVSSEFPTFNVDTGRISSSFLHQYLRSPTFMRSIAGTANGLGQRRQRVSPTSFLSIPCPLPPRIRQDRIAAHLASLEKQLGRTDATIPRHDPLHMLPGELGRILRAQSLPSTQLGDLFVNRQVVIHPGDDAQGAEQFVGLEHIQRHTGTKLDSRALGEETGRKLLFQRGQVVYGYLRPYLNKAWAATHTGLCSVEQFVLIPCEDVSPSALSALLRSDIVYDQAVEATNGLQLPRLSLSKLRSFAVPDVRQLRDQSSFESRCLEATNLLMKLAQLHGRRHSLQDAILPAARNEIFSTMR